MEQIVVKYSPRGASLRERSIAAAAACANSSGATSSLASSIVSVTRSEADRAGISEREPPPFARLFASFGSRGGLLLVAPSALLLIFLLVTIALWDGEVQYWTSISLPNAYFQAVTHAVIAWTLHKVNRPGGAYEVISETGLNKKCTSIMWGAWDEAGMAANLPASVKKRYNDGPQSARSSTTSIFLKI